jgi:oligosaccharide translocation protein RFT1
MVPLLLLLLFFPSSSSSSANMKASYRISLVSCVCAALIELTSEPHYVWLQKKQLFGSRVMAETVGTFARTAILFYHLSSSHIDYSTILSKEKRKTNVLYAFAFAQVGQSCATSAVYAASYYLYRKRDDDVRKKQKKRRKGTKTTTDGKKERSDDDEKKQRLLIDSFLYQSYLKLALAEGEKFALIVANSEDTVMGVFGLVSNLGSLFVRLVLQPFEEIAFVTFAASATKDKKKEKLGDILSIGVLVGTIAFFVGPFFAKDVMYFLYGKKWMEDGTETLQAYARLILPLSINGIVEGFAHAVMNEREIKKHGNAWLVSCSFVNCALGFSLLKYSRIGAAGLVYGNFISLMMRIYLTSRFLIRTGKLSSTIFRETLPKPGTLVAVAACTFALTAIKDDTNGRKTAEMTPNFKHTVVTGGSVAVALLIALFVWEQDRFRNVFSTNSFKRKRN